MKSIKETLGNCMNQIRGFPELHFLRSPLTLYKHVFGGKTFSPQINLPHFLLFSLAQTWVRRQSSCFVAFTNHKFKEQTIKRIKGICVEIDHKVRFIVIKGKALFRTPH